MKDTLEFMLKKMNEIVSHNNSKEAGAKKEKYHFLDLVNWAAIHAGSLQTSLSPSCFISVFRELGLRTMNHQKYCETTKDIVVTDASNHVSSSLTWSSSRDKTHELGSYEEIAFKASKDIFFVPNHIVVTLDDDLIGSRSKDVQNKLLSQIKAAKEGHDEDVLC